MGDLASSNSRSQSCCEHLGPEEPLNSTLTTPVVSGLIERFDTGAF